MIPTCVAIEDMEWKYTDYCNCDPSKCENTDGSPSALINEDLDFLIKKQFLYFKVWERTVQAFELEGVQIGGSDGKSKSDESIVTREEQAEKIPPKPSVSFEDLFSKES